MKSLEFYQVVATKATSASGEKHVVRDATCGSKRFRGAFSAAGSEKSGNKKTGIDPLEAARQTLADGRTRKFGLFVSEKELTDAGFTIL